MIYFHEKDKMQKSKFHLIIWWRLYRYDDRALNDDSDDDDDDGDDDDDDDRRWVWLSLDPL